MARDAERLMAYVDGELDVDARTAFEHDMIADPSLVRAVESERGLRARIAKRYAAVFDEPVPPALSGMLDRGEVIDLAVARERRGLRARLPEWRAAAAVAATLVAGFVAGHVVSLDGGEPVGTSDGVLVARGALADALDVQLASTQPPDAPVRIGLSFTETAGAYCRSFAQAALGGIACHEGGEWRIRYTSAGQRIGQTGYRQAASADAVLMEAAQRMMASDALDAQAERAARDGGWKAAATVRQ